jgi:hypothetical protein
MTNATSSPHALPAHDAGGQATAQEAEEEMAALTAPLTARRSACARLGRLRVPVIMTALGAGLRLLGPGGTLATALGGACAAFLLVAMATEAATARLGWLAAHDPAPWAWAAQICEQPLPARLAPDVLAVITRYRAIAHTCCPAVHVYVPRCTGHHTPLCTTTSALRIGGTVLLVTGHDAARRPQVTAAGLAHELGHLGGWTRRVLLLASSARSGWGWMLAAECWALAGWDAHGWAASWPGLLAAAATFQVISVLASWVAEAACDLRAARTAGHAAVLAAFAFYAPSYRPTTPRAWAWATVAWITGPTHPPIWARRLIVHAPHPGPARLT